MLIYLFIFCLNALGVDPMQQLKNQVRQDSVRFQAVHNAWLEKRRKEQIASKENLQIVYNLLRETNKACWVMEAMNEGLKDLEQQPLFIENSLCRKTLQEFVNKEHELSHDDRKVLAETKEYDIFVVNITKAALDNNRQSEKSDLAKRLDENGSIEDIEQK